MVCYFNYWKIENKTKNTVICSKDIAMFLIQLRQGTLRVYKLRMAHSYAQQQTDADGGFDILISD